MSDNQTSKTTTIDDLVKELSKNNNPNQEPPPLKATASQGPPPNLPGVKIDSTPVAPPVSSPAPSASPTKLPSSPPISSQPSPLPQPAPSGPQPSQTRPQPFLSPKPFDTAQGKPTTSPLLYQQSQQPLKSPPQEYKSSIRTMGEDIASLKSGQKPSGIDVPRKITPEFPQMMSGISKPATPAPSTGGPISSIGLGRAERTSPLPSPPLPKKPVETPKPPEIKPSIVVPSVKRKLELGRTFYMFLAGILIVGGFLYWFFVWKTEPGVVVSPTPSPTLTITPTTTPKTLLEVLVPLSAVKPYIVINKIPSTQNFLTGLNNEVKSLPPLGGEFIVLNLVDENENPYSLGSIFARLNMIHLPSGLLENPDGKDWVFSIYGQQETFDSKGIMTFNELPKSKLIFATEVSDPISLRNALNDWEITIVDDLKNLFNLDTQKITSETFLDNTYRETDIRYKNFPYADNTIDYAIVNLPEFGTDYFVLTNSRESMYLIIDLLKDQ